MKPLRFLTFELELDQLNAKNTVFKNGTTLCLPYDMIQIPSLPITSFDTGIRTHDLSIPVP